MTTPMPKPCPNVEMGCDNQAQCWEPCGALGHSAAHARVSTRSTPMPELPVPSGYGIKSLYGFDPQDGHKRLIGLSIDKPDTWPDSRIVQLYTAEQMQAYARAAIEASQPAVRADGFSESADERRLRRMLCATRHGSAAYMDDGEASFDNIDYMRHPLDHIQTQWLKVQLKMVAAIEAATEQGKRQPLSDERIYELGSDDFGLPHRMRDFAHAIEAAHGITATPQGNPS